MRLINKISKSIAFRSILIIVTLLIVYSAVSGIMGYRATSQSLYDQYTEDAFQVANAAAFFIDGDTLDDMIEAGEDSERGKAIKRLQNRIRAIKKGKDTEEEYIPGLANPDGNEEEIMRQIRGVRAQGLRELGIR